MFGTYLNLKVRLNELLRSQQGELALSSNRFESRDEKKVPFRFISISDVSRCKIFAEQVFLSVRLSLILK